MKKLSLETLSVESFATGEAARAPRGTVRAHLSGLPCDLTHNGCPTQYCTPPTGFVGDA